MRHDVKVLGLVSGGHFFSHFYFLLLPPLFPILKTEFDVSYSALGLLLSIGAAATTLFQTPVGFLVDRFGPRQLLITGIMLHSLSIVAMSFTEGFAALVFLFAIAGLANTVYHPADYAILNANISEERLGRAYSIHTFSGNIAWALAPGIIVALTAIWSWREALLLLGIAGVGMGCLLYLNRNLLNIRTPGQNLESNRLSKSFSPQLTSGISLLLSPPILAALVFFIFISMGTGAIRVYSVSALVSIYEMPLATANGALTGFLAGASGGILIGGIIADRFRKPELIASSGFLIGAILLAGIGTVLLPIAIIIGGLSFAGFVTGFVQPSRDMIIRTVTPAGSTGKVYAFVSTGLSIGGMLTPVLFGWIMDNADPRWVFWLSAAIVAMAIGTVGALSAARQKWKSGSTVQYS